MLSVDATRLLLGVVLLAFGRKLFWVFVGAVGFVAGIRFAEHFHLNVPDDTVIMYSIIFGVVCAVMAVAIRKVAVAAAGFFAGGYFLVQLFNVSGGLGTGGGGAQTAPWLLFLVGGVVGAVLMNMIFNWTLIVLSSIGGATLICETLTANKDAVRNALSFYSGVKTHGDAPALDPHVVSVVFTILVILGVLVQAGTFRYLRRSDTPPPPP